jgi:hypothetical protein
MQRSRHVSIVTGTGLDCGETEEPMARRSKAAAGLGLIGAVLAATLLLTDAVAAQSRICRQIEAQLTGAAGSRAGGAAKYNRAIRLQQTHLDKARRQARRAGCIGGGFSSFERGSRTNCDSLYATIDRMERNLNSLERQRSQSGGGRLTRRERARLLATYEANGCGDDVRYAERQAPRQTPGRAERGTILDQIFGGGVPRRDPEPETSRQVRTLSEDGLRGAVRAPDVPQTAYRTLCVRTCDGYFFPISYSSAESDFDRDQQNCQAMCPGAEVQLFSHRIPEEESEDMVSRVGVPYRELPTAFKYRDPGYTRPATCGCSATRNFSVLAGDTSSPGEKQADEAAEFIPLPSPRPDPAADPETRAQRRGGFDSAALSRVLASQPGAQGQPAEKRIRVVGPVFLPDPEGAIDLRAPGRRTVQ